MKTRISMRAYPTHRSNREEHTKDYNFWRKLKKTDPEAAEFLAEFNNDYASTDNNPVTRQIPNQAAIGV
jgi:hypothetical protein